ncbi:hypothetical protein KXW66_007538 [Aspergillus fumigatus]|nr:hypothetical protein KXW66_007538 [Aspergillus fumigatus]
MSTPSISFTSLGLVVLDEIRFPNQEPLLDVLGGSGAYATLGARLFLRPPLSRTLGWMIHTGHDFPELMTDRLRSWDSTLIVKREADKPSTRGLLEYEDTTPASLPRSMSTFSPLTTSNSPPSSANPQQKAHDKATIEALARRVLDSGVGIDGKGTVVVRAGENGSVVVSRDLPPTWLPPFYPAGADGRQHSNVVDPTGAGNAFLGAYVVGYLQTQNAVEAACYGTVGGSFALEQVGMPELVSGEDGELWNGADAFERLLRLQWRPQYEALRAIRDIRCITDYCVSAD